MGGEGSGKSKGATNAVEELLAAKFRGDTASIAEQLKVLAGEFKNGTSRMSPSDLDSLTTKILGHLSWTVVDAEAGPRDRLGDVRVDLTDGSKCWIEVKAQTMKPKFADITQADFVREGTDFLRSYAQHDNAFGSIIPASLREELNLDAAMLHGTSWGLADLWLADLALLVDDKKKQRAGATTISGLKLFLQKKYFLQFCMEGARIVRLDQLAPISDIINGKAMHTKLKLSNSGNVASVQVRAGAAPSWGATDFTYHVGYKNAPGRHKLHDHAISRSNSLVVFTP